MVRIGLNERSKALESLRQAADRHVADVLVLAVNPFFDAVREDSDFQALCSKLELPRTGKAK